MGNWLCKRIPEGQMFPRFYGLAWYEYLTNQAVAAPIPLNWVLSISRAAWYFVRFGNRHLARAPQDAYAQGLRDARKAMRPIPKKED